MTDYADLIRIYVDAARVKEQEQMEYLCEVMLTTPNSSGISVQRFWSGLSCTTVTRLNPDVPFGQIYYLPDVHE